VTQSYLHVELRTKSRVVLFAFLVITPWFLVALKINSWDSVSNILREVSDTCCGNKKRFPDSHVSKSLLIFLSHIGKHLTVRRRL
jgi:hypothetical protein